MLFLLIRVSALLFLLFHGLPAAGYLPVAALGYDEFGAAFAAYVFLTDLIGH